MRSLVFAVCLVASVATSPVVAGQSKLDFTLMNRTGLIISELYVSPTTNKDWEEDVLGSDVLKSGDSLDISFARSEKSCSWDLKIVDEDEDEVEWSALNLCTASHITLMYQNGKATAIVK